MNRILILEINGDSAVLLTVDGAFQTVLAQPGWEVGMELDADCLELAPEEQGAQLGKAPKKGRVVALRRARHWVIAAAACLLLLMGVQQGYSVLTTADASVEIAINPVVRIEMNRFGGVVGLVGVNEDGKTLLEKVGQSNSSAAEALRSILNQAIVDGYLSEEGRDVLISVAGTTGQKTQQLENDMADTANQVFEEKGVRPKVSVQKHSFETTKQMRAYIDALVAQGMDLEEAYEQAGLGEDFLDLMGVRVHGNGKIELRFTQAFTLNGGESITITPASGEPVAAELVEVKDDRFSVTAGGVEAGTACTVRVTGMTDDQGIERSFTANFCNRKGRYARYKEAEDCARMERFGDGRFRVLLEHQKDETRLAGEESAVALTRSGEQISCEVVGFEEGWWYLRAEEDFSAGEIVSVVIFNVQSEKGKDTLFEDAFVWESSYPVVERTQFNAEDDVVEVEFTEDFDWQSNLHVTAVAPDGTRINGDIVEWPDGNDMELRFNGLREGETYQLEIIGTPFSLQVTGAFIASDNAEIDRGNA